MQKNSIDLLAVTPESFYLITFQLSLNNYTINEEVG